MRADQLYVVTAVANPIRWSSRLLNANKAILEWAEDGANVTIVECAYGARPFDLVELSQMCPNITHIGVRARTLLWNKECLINIGISRLPAEANYIGVFDADIHFRKRSWAAETVHALQLYPVIQPWSDCYDLGPHDEHMQSHKSFCRQFHDGFPVVPNSKHFWKFDGGPYDYPHSGYAWAWSRSALDDVGGLLDICAMGSGDHHMALGLVGAAEKSMPAKTHANYRDLIMRWQSRAMHHINTKIGFVPGTIEHYFHGAKINRKYVNRWEMFIEHHFDPATDIKRNTYGVYEFSGQKPELERAFDRYLRAREEDANIF
jgi:hypothetical protein